MWQLSDVHLCRMEEGGYKIRLQAIKEVKATRYKISGLTCIAGLALSLYT